MAQPPLSSALRAYRSAAALHRYEGAGTANTNARPRPRNVAPKRAGKDCGAAPYTVPRLPDPASVACLICVALMVPETHRDAPTMHRNTPISHRDALPLAHRDASPRCAACRSLSPRAARGTMTAPLARRSVLARSPAQPPRERPLDLPGPAAYYGRQQRKTLGARSHPPLEAPYRNNSSNGAAYCDERDMRDLEREAREREMRDSGDARLGRCAIAS
ncbi:hypothetical protein C8J57DRAFT_1737034 [Mycena rebaudengoi]|nr:hypothetical protein C8J57DRAFT_1737034 [Mycena rebaudengoi]